MKTSPLAAGEGRDHAGTASLELAGMDEHLVANHAHDGFGFLQGTVERHMSLEALLFAADRRGQGEDERSR